MLVNGKFEDGPGKLATHTNGDLLIVSDFSNGGGVSTINVYKWPNGALAFLAGGDGVKCGAALADKDPFCGIVNPPRTGHRGAVDVHRQERQRTTT